MLFICDVFLTIWEITLTTYVLTESPTLRTIGLEAAQSGTLTVGCSGYWRVNLPNLISLCVFANNVAPTIFINYSYYLPYQRTSES